MKNVVVIGGGHGQSVILKGIKEIPDINISAIVTVADDGGSTGRIRKLYSVPAMGDIRNVLISLSESESLFSELMNYRFPGSDEEDIIGHNLGNLILLATTEICGSFTESITLLADILKVKGDIIPSSLETITLYARMDDDTIVKGEANIPSYNQHISSVFYDHDVKGNKEAIEAIEKADLIIYGIGSLYTSILPNTIIKDINEALHKTKAKRVYFANCMTQPNETFGYDLKDYLDAFEKHNTPIDLVVQHKDIIPESIRQRYFDQNAEEIINHGDCDIPIIRRELLEFNQGLVRHCSEKIEVVVRELLEK